mmetsp:Transcript_9710/g.22878  ORF Transcript_9710/g.22878 Transcript_9710/m.22878 type:complete len:86 (+) Transcript_9710:2069-2326(+)
MQSTVACCIVSCGLLKHQLKILFEAEGYDYFDGPIKREKCTFREAPTKQNNQIKTSQKRLRCLVDSVLYSIKQCTVQQCVLDALC